MSVNSLFPVLLHVLCIIIIANLCGVFEGLKTNIKFVIKDAKSVANSDSTSSFHSCDSNQDISSAIKLKIRRLEEELNYEKDQLQKLQEANEISADDKEEDDTKLGWIKMYTGFTSDTCIPAGVVNAGIRDHEGVFVARGNFWREGYIIPGKAVVGHSAAYIPNDGAEVSFKEFEMLRLPKKSVSWVASCGHVPENAVQGGHTVQGEKLYIGRVLHNGETCVGNFWPSRNGLFITYAGQVVAHRCFEVLVDKN